MSFHTAWTQCGHPAMQPVVRSTSHNHTQVLDRRNHSGLMLAARITLAHFSVSWAMSLPKSAGEPDTGVPPKSASRALNFGSARPALISLLSF
jgi:hypothetical protein